MTRRLGRITLVAALVAVPLSVTGTSPAFAVESRLPGGTGISVSIDNVFDDEIVSPGPLTVRGRAAVGRSTAPDTALMVVVDLSDSTMDKACDPNGHTPDTHPPAEEIFPPQEPPDSDPGGPGGGPPDPTGPTAPPTTPHPGDAEPDVVDCEQAAASRVVQRAVDSHTVGAMGVIGFGTDAVLADPDPGDADPGFVVPDADADHDGVRDLDTVILSLSNSENTLQKSAIRRFTNKPVQASTTDFGKAITAAGNAARDSGRPGKVAIFLSDGDNSSSAFDTAIDGLPMGMVFDTIAVGGTCGKVDENSLARLADRTHGTCQAMTSGHDLPDQAGNVLAAALTRLAVTVDDGPEQVIDAGLPKAGPVDVGYETTLPYLASGVHRVCVVAKGRDAAGPGSVGDCRRVVVNAPPVITTGGPYSGLEDHPIAIRGTYEDPDGPPGSTSWSYTRDSGDPSATCVIADPARLATTITCDRFGDYTLTLTGSDGMFRLVIERTRLHVTNVPPVVDAGGPYAGAEDTAVPIRGTVTDPDDPEPTVSWSVEPGADVPATAKCVIVPPGALAASVTCDEHGEYTLTLTATDGADQTVSDSTTIRFDNRPPVIDAGGPYTGQEGTSVELTGTVTDPDSPDATATWSVEPATSPCAFTSTDQLSTRITCTKPGTYTLVLTVDDDVNDPITDRATLTVSAAPVPTGALSLSLAVDPSPGYVGGTPVTAVYTVRNTGPVPMTDVRLSTPVPAGLATGQPAGCPTPCALGTLAPGQTVEVRAAYIATGGVDVPVTASVTTTGPDTDPGDNTATARIVVRRPVLRVDPTAGPQGSVTNAIGQDFPPDATVRLSWNPGISEFPGLVRVRPDGTFTVSVLVFHKDILGPRALWADPVAGPPFGRTGSGDYVVMIRTLKPVVFEVRGDPRFVTR
ncbi:DUF11 domain-containing protein [Actinokineospora enzanensis]|uniref:DUF11 domain-containing protein n=1 Tax=Actinokineospora enzanensis TaxID=155975 RepID=UPI00039B9A05|nr:DUF11 domain-containing protein [Actinokineospora enzanensis]